jgi:glutamate racemase
MRFAQMKVVVMTAESFVKLLEEMVDIKVHQHAEVHLQGKPELARLLEEKRYTDRRRLEMIKQELVRLLTVPES